MGSKSNAIFIVQSHSKVSVDLNYPDKPAPGTVNEGYHENMDKPRPSYLDEYLESVFILYEKQFSLMCHRNFNVIFVIDDSGSVGGRAFSSIAVFSCFLQIDERREMVSSPQRSCSDWE